MPLKDISALKRARSEKVKTMRALLDAAEERTEKTLTAEEETRYESLETEVRNMDKEISREEELQRRELAAKGNEEHTEGEYRDFADFLMDVRSGNSSRLQQRDVTMGDGASTGFIAPEQFDNTIRMYNAPGAIFRPRAMVIPAGTPPDAAMNLVALDQSGSKGVYSGVTVKWVSEGGTRQDGGDPSVRTIKIEPQEVSGYIDVSDKLLRNSAAAGALVERLLRGAIIGSEEDAFFSGDGVGKPLGINGHAATIEITRTTANTIVFADVVGMYARMKFGGSILWVCSQTCLPKLMTLKDEANQLIWQPNAREAAPGSLLGIPVLINDQAPTLGSTGDLTLLDLNYYAIKDGSPLAIFMDPYTQKVNGVTRIYAFWNVDGQPMLNTPMTLRDGTNTVSPFVTLKAA
jgi:HK97 family phage major capsid protein